MSIPDPYGSDPQSLLIEVQDLDTLLAQIDHRRETLVERLQLAEAEKALAALLAREADVKGRRQVITDKVKDLEASVTALSTRSSQLETRLYDTKGGSARDLQAIDGEIHQLAEKRSAIEESELELMIEADPLDKELGEIETQRTALETATITLRTALQAAETILGADREATAYTREQRAAELPKELLEDYERIRSHLGGVGAARLIGSRCEGCHLDLPSMEVERIRHEPSHVVITCDQCGRILIRGSVPAPPPGYTTTHAD